MIIWISSYPKSGNTWIRSLLCSYLFSKNGVFSFNQLDNIRQFSSKNLTLNHINNANYQNTISENWIPAQEIINKDNKIHFLKTHNAMCNINDNYFTNKKNTLAAIYIVRDPRNLVCSLSHHYEIAYSKAFEFITNKRKIIFPKSFSKDGNPDDFNFLGDWSSHYKSWKNIKFCAVKVIKYEDIITDAEKVFMSTLNFLSQFIKLDIDKKKIINSLNTTSFENLKKMEAREGFKESVFSAKTRKKINFFNMGKDNNWRGVLEKNIAGDLENSFSSTMKELGYL